VTGIAIEDAVVPGTCWARRRRRPATLGPVIYQVHATAAWVIWAVWPFSRLVHAWSYPLWYLWRPYIVYRSRRPVPPAEPGTSGRRWRKIGVPY
jgi:nitrate reductase gamma subunit